MNQSTGMAVNYTANQVYKRHSWTSPLSIFNTAFKGLCSTLKYEIITVGAVTLNLSR